MITKMSGTCKIIISITPKSPTQLIIAKYIHVLTYTNSVIFKFNKGGENYL